MHISTGLKYVCVNGDAPVYGCVVIVTAITWEPARKNKCRVRFICDSKEYTKGWVFTVDRDRFEHDFLVHPAEPLETRDSGYTAERDMYPDGLPQFTQ